MKTQDIGIDHEVRIRLLEKIAEKINNNFKWTAGLIFAGSLTTIAFLAPMVIALLLKTHVS